MPHLGTTGKHAVTTGIAVTTADRGVRYFLVRVSEFTTR